MLLRTLLGIMPSMVSAEYDFAFVGGIREDYSITHDGRVHLGILGGNAVYAAVGAKVWSVSVGIIGRVGSNYPLRWLEELREAGISIDGIRVLPESLDTRTFYAYLSEDERVDTNPASHFLRIGQPFPKELLDYSSSTDGQDSRSEFGPLAIRPDDIPTRIVTTRAAHLSPADLLTHLTVPMRLRDLRVRLITLDPSERYMTPTFQSDLPNILSGVDAFLPNEAEAREWFRPDEPGLWEMAEAFGAMGCPVVAIKRGARGQCVWDASARARWSLPAYPTRPSNVTGAGDAYCGGFLVGMEQTGDVLEAALRGSVSASLAIEGSGALYSLDALPGLAQARLEALRPLAKRG